MGDNPYRASASNPDRVRTRSADLDRPLGVSLLAGLNLLGGLVLCGMLAFLLLQGITFAPVQDLGIYPPLLIGGFLLVGLVLIGAGLGMLQGARWGWWLGIFSQVYTIVRNASALVIVPGMEDSLAVEREFQLQVLRLATRSVVSVLLIGYFFRRNVLEYFGLEELNRVVALIALIFVCAAILVATNAINWLALGV